MPPSDSSSSHRIHPCQRRVQRLPRQLPRQHQRRVHHQPAAATAAAHPDSHPLDIARVVSVLAATATATARTTHSTTIATAQPEQAQQPQPARASQAELDALPAYRNYSRGVPSATLFVKNIDHRRTTDADLLALFRATLAAHTDTLNDTLNGIHVRLMREGRMKGQAFVTLPSVALAETALDALHGAVLHSRPLVMQFGRAASGTASGTATGTTPGTATGTATQQ